jgi:predicted outer membrane repeat protein
MRRLLLLVGILVAFLSGCDVFLPSEGYYNQPCSTGSVPCEGDGLVCIGGICKLPDEIDTLYVDDDATPGGDGSSWSSAFAHPQDAVNAASDGSEIWVAAGTYTRINISDTSVLNMAAGVSLYGGFFGNEIVRDQRDPLIHKSILDGGNVCKHVVKGASNATIDGFSIRGGLADSTTFPDGLGGGMYNDAVSNLTVNKCGFVFNRAIYGGGIYNSGCASITIQHCIFIGNTADSDGGAIKTVNGAPLVKNCLFIGNQADNGAAISVENSSPNIMNCTFSTNSATNFGGAIYGSASASFSILNSILWGDYAGNGDEEIHMNNLPGPTVSSSCIEHGYVGTGNISGDPNFVTGDLGDFYLSQVAAGQASTSACVDSGSGTSSERGLAERTTRTDGVGDSGTVDMGFHSVE